MHARHEKMILFGDHWSKAKTRAPAKDLYVVRVIELIPPYCGTDARLYSYVCYNRAHLTMMRKEEGTVPV